MLNTMMLEVHTAMETQEENKSTGWNHKDSMKVTFRLRHKISQVCQILQTAHSVPIPAYVDSMATSLVK